MAAALAISLFTHLSLAYNVSLAVKINDLDPLQTCNRGNG
jgi:hypothetical protein